MAKQRQGRKQEVDFTWEVDGEVLHASDGWVQCGGQWIMAMGETSWGFPFGITLQEYQAIRAQEAEREKRLEARATMTWEHLTVDLGGVKQALDSCNPELLWVLDLNSGEALCFTEEEREGNPEDPWEHPDRYLVIHPAKYQERLKIMTDFVASLPSGKPSRFLGQSLRRRHPFRAFRATLNGYPQLREDWFEFQMRLPGNGRLLFLDRPLPGLGCRLVPLAFGCTLLGQPHKQGHGAAARHTRPRSRWLLFEKSQVERPDQRRVLRQDQLGDQVIIRQFYQAFADRNPAIQPVAVKGPDGMHHLPSDEFGNPVQTAEALWSKMGGCGSGRSIPGILTARA